MYSFSVVDLLQSTGPIALNELIMRLPAAPYESVLALKKLEEDGRISITGPMARRILSLQGDPSQPANTALSNSISDDEILGASDTFIEPSSSSWRRSLAS